MERMSGTYWEDRLRNDWLLILSRARDWTNFSAELPRFRMNGDRQVSCYALMLDAASGRLLASVATGRNSRGFGDFIGTPPAAAAP